METEPSVAHGGDVTAGEHLSRQDSGKDEVQDCRFVVKTAGGNSQDRNGADGGNHEHGSRKEVGTHR